jgi:hypothetical protein
MQPNMKKHQNDAAKKYKTSFSSIVIAVFVLLQLSILLSSCNFVGGIFNAVWDTVYLPSLQ